MFFKNQNYAGEYAIPHCVRNDTFGITMRVNICFLFVSLLGTTKKGVIARQRSCRGNPINDYNTKKSSRACQRQAWWSHIGYLGTVLMFFSITNIFGWICHSSLRIFNPRSKWRKKWYHL